jgi:hypothetical protein
MNIKYENFIGTYEDVYPEGFCEHLILEFERLAETGAGVNRQAYQNSSYASKHHKNDLQMNFNVGVHSISPFNDFSTRDVFFEGLQKCYDSYTEEFSILRDNNINATHIKMQRTDPGGGYHIWHCEQNNGDQAGRVLVYSLYLNNIEEKEGGETEFLYQRKRIHPVKNTMIIWPAAYTHTHRGNPVLGETSKYIATGWFFYE